MNAITAAPDREQPCGIEKNAAGPTADHNPEQASAARSRPPDAPAANRIPVYRAGELKGFVHRESPPPPAAPSIVQEHASTDDTCMRLDIAAIWRDESGTDTDRVSISVERGVVRLSGEIDNVHDKMALLRIAAAMAATVAIVDDLWLSCE
jgi:hypothetical protein